MLVSVPYAAYKLINTTDPSPSYVRESHRGQAAQNACSIDALYFLFLNPLSPYLNPSPYYLNQLSTKPLPWKVIIHFSKYALNILGLLARPLPWKL
jgi:hypothetical protein